MPACQSRPDIPEFARGCFCDSAYADSLLNNDIEETLRWIAGYGVPDFVIPGCETGVTFADELSTRLGTRFQNKADTSVARRDKFLMTQTIRSAGLRGVRQERCTSAEEAVDWVARDTVSSAGVVVISDVIRYGKRIGVSGHSVYEYCDFLSTDDPEVREIVDYTRQVVEALGIVRWTGCRGHCPNDEPGF